MPSKIFPFMPIPENISKYKERIGKFNIVNHPCKSLHSREMLIPTPLVALGGDILALFASLLIPYSLF